MAHEINITKAKPETKHRRLRPRQRRDRHLHAELRPGRASVEARLPLELIYETVEHSSSLSAGAVVDGLLAGGTIGAACTRGAYSRILPSPTTQ